MVKNPPANAGDIRDAGLISGLGRSPGEGKGYPLQYSGLENSMDHTVHGVTKSQTRLRDFHFISLAEFPLSERQHEPFFFILKICLLTDRLANYGL